MFSLDYSDRRPIYEQIKDKIKELIISGVLKENDKIPSVRELAGNLAINPNTIQKAYKDLESEGCIYSVQSKGSFVAPKDNIKSKNNVSELISDFRKNVNLLKYYGTTREELMKIIDSEYEK